MELLYITYLVRSSEMAKNLILADFFSSILDANQDGYLSRAELRYVLCNTGNRLSPAEFEDFLKTFDLDNDGHVSCEEYIHIASSSLIDYMDEIVRMKER